MCLQYSCSFFLVCAGDALKTLDPSTFKKWSSYLKMKATFYEAHVRQQHSMHAVCVCLTHVFLAHVHSVLFGWDRPTVSLGKNCLERRSVVKLFES